VHSVSVCTRHGNDLRIVNSSKRTVEAAMLQHGPPLDNDDDDDDKLKVGFCSLKHCVSL